MKNSINELNNSNYKFCRMIQMKKLLIIYMLIVGIVLISGCTSDVKSTDLMTQTDTRANLKSDSQMTDPNDELNTLEPFIDPKLKNIKFENSDPDIEVVRLELIDLRDYAESDNWRTNLLLSNNGNQPVYIAVNMKYNSGNRNTLYYPAKFNILNSGERMWKNLSPVREIYGKGHALNDLYGFVIISDKTIKPNISPEFKNLEYFSFTKESISTTLPAPFIDLYSIKYEITDDGFGWESLVIEVSTDNKDGGMVGFHFLDSHHKPLRHDDGVTVSVGILLSPGKTEIIKVPLRKFSPDDLYGVDIKTRHLNMYEERKMEEQT